MKLRLAILGTSLALTAPLPASAPRVSDWIIGTGQAEVYDTANGPVTVGTLRIEAGAELIVRGSQAFHVTARSIEVDGLLDLSGFDSPGVFTLNTPQLPEPGAPGGPAAGSGGGASRNTVGATPAGNVGRGPGGSFGGAGGESGWAVTTTPQARRGAGGGGGVLGPDQPAVSGNPEHPANLGLIALAGVSGNAGAKGALSGTAPPVGGAPGAVVFVDGDPTNDFFGRKNGTGGSLIVGELSAPTAGRGGGGGGDSIRVPGGSYPPPTFVLTHHDKGGSGGGGGGLAILQATSISVGSAGSIVSDGGSGGGGENTLVLDRIGAGGGAGSGGMLVLEARVT